jgi:hypothetical protein
MGIITRAYQIPPGALQPLVESPQHLEALRGYAGELPTAALGLPAGWRPQTYDFDKSWEDLLRVLRACGYARAAALLDNGTEVDSGSDAWIRYLTPGAARAVARMLASARAAELTRVGLERGVTDYWGEVLVLAMYEYVIGDIERLAAFFRQAAEAGTYILLVSA